MGKGRGIIVGGIVGAFIAVASTGLPAGAVSPPDVVAAAVVSSISLASSVTPSVSGQSVTFTATLTCAATPLSGHVTFLDGASPIAAAPLDATSTATFSTAGLEPGSHSITATFAATPECDASTSASVSQQVDKGASSMYLDTSVLVAVLGRPLVVTAHVRPISPATGTPTGTVTFSVNGTNFSPVGLDDAGNATTTVPDPGVFSGGTPCGSCFDLSATYSGDARFEPTSFSEGGGGVISVPEVGTMQSSVGSGPPGSSMSVRSVTGCPPTPSDPTTGWRVDVTLVQGATAIGSTSIPINRYGYQSGQVGLMWEGGLLVDTRATPGAATLRASCVATPEGALPEGAVASYAYEPLSFTVTNPSTGRPTTEQGAELARTGRSPWMLTLTGILSLLVGLTLIVASRRRGITSDLPRPQGRGGR